VNLSQKQQLQSLFLLLLLFQAGDSVGEIGDSAVLIHTAVDTFNTIFNNINSEATTAKPLPASPALAASIDALSDKRLVSSAISPISLIISTISLEAEPTLLTASSRLLIQAMRQMIAQIEDVSVRLKEQAVSSKNVSGEMNTAADIRLSRCVNLTTQLTSYQCQLMR